jgi:hypothetical protein
VHGVEHVAHSLENDLKKVFQDALAMTEALMQGNLKLAMQDLLKTAEDVGKTATDAATASAEATLEGLQGLHLGKGFDKVLNSVEKEVETVKSDVNKGLDAAAEDLVSSVEGVVSGSVRALKDLAHGDLHGMMNDLAKVGEDAIQVAADLTPEGLGATVVASTLAAAHIGNAQLDETIAAAMHGGVGKVVKSVTELEVGQGAQKVGEKLMSSGGDPTTAATTGGDVLALASMVPGGTGRRGGRRGSEGSHETRSAEGETPKNGGADGHERDGKTETKTDSKEKTDDSKEKEKDEKTQQAGPPPNTLDTLLLSYLADNHRRIA